MGQHLPSFSKPSWFACHTKPRCEKKFDALVGTAGFEHYLPLVESVRRYGAQQKVFAKPLLPGYVFARLDPERKENVYRQDLLVRAIRVDNEPVFLRQLENLRTLCASGLEAVLHPLLRKGTPVKVVGGPLHGIEGRVDDPENPQGIVVSIDVLQQGLLIRLPLDCLQPLP